MYVQHSLAETSAVNAVDHGQLGASGRLTGDGARKTGVERTGRRTHTDGRRLADGTRGSFFHFSRQILQHQPYGL